MPIVPIIIGVIIGLIIVYYIFKSIIKFSQSIKIVEHGQKVLVDDKPGIVFTPDGYKKECNENPGSENQLIIKNNVQLGIILQKKPVIYLGDEIFQNKKVEEWYEVPVLKDEPNCNHVEIGNETFGFYNLKNSGDNSKVVPLEKLGL